MGRILRNLVKRNESSKTFKIWDVEAFANTIIHSSLISSLPILEWRNFYCAERDASVMGTRRQELSCCCIQTRVGDLFSASCPLIGQAVIIPTSHWPRKLCGYNSDPHLRWQFQLLSINRKQIFCRTSLVNARNEMCFTSNLGAWGLCGEILMII